MRLLRRTPARTPAPVVRHLMVGVTLGLISLAVPAGATDRHWPDPLDFSREVLVGAPESLAGDACGCLRELQACLLGALVGQQQCLERAPNPAREALCYLKLEIDLLLCVEQAASCELTCVP